MKNFFKKLSFVLASAMVITSLYAPANAEAASKNFLRTKGSKKAAKSVTLVANNKGVNFDYTFGKKTKGMKGTWKVSDSSVLKLNKKNGYVTPLQEGKATVSFTTKLGKKKVTVKTTVMVKAAKVASLTLEEMKRSVKVGETLDVMPEITLTEEAMKLGAKKTSDKLFASSDIDDVASVKVVGSKLVVTGVKSGKANISFYAAASKDDETKVEGTKFEVEVVGDLSAKQTAANMITVTGADLTADAKDYEIKNEKGVALSVENTVKVENGEAVITSLSKQIPVGKYTLSFKKGTPVEFMVEKSEAKEIVFVPEDQAILSGDKKTAKVYYKVVDQFGSDVTKEYASSNVNISSNRITKNQKPGEVELQATVEQKTGNAYGSDEFRPGFDTVNITVTIITGDYRTITKNADLKVIDEARVWEIGYKGIWDVVNRKIVQSLPADAAEDVDSEGNLLEFKLLLTAKDQFGRDFYEATGNKNTNSAIEAYNQVQVFLGGTTGLIANTGKDKLGKDQAKIEDIQGTKYLSYPLKVTNKELREGKVDVNAFVINNDKKIKEEFEVTPTLNVADIEVTEPIGGVYAGQVNTLDYKLLDGEGKEVKDWRKIKKLNKPQHIKQYDKGGHVWFERDLKNDKVLLKYIPQVEPANGQPVIQMLSFVSLTNKHKLAQIMVKARRYPVAISRIKDIHRGVTRKAADSHFVRITSDDLVYQDQYGNDMFANEVAAWNNFMKGSAVKLRVWFGDLDDTNKVMNGITPLAKGATLTEADFTNVTSHAVTDFAAGNVADENALTSVSTNFNAVGNIVRVRPAKDVMPDDKATKSAKVNVQLIAPNRQGTLKQVSTFSFRIYNALLDNLYNVAVNDVKTQPAKDLDYSTKHVRTTTTMGDALGDALKGANLDYVDNRYATVGVHGYYDGAKIMLVADDDFDVITVMNDKKTVIIPAMASIPYGKMDAEASFDVSVHKTTPLRLTKTYKYSKEPRHIAKVNAPDNRKIAIGKEATDTTPKGWLKGGTNEDELAKNFSLEDQYEERVEKTYMFDTETENLTPTEVNAVKTTALARLLPVIEVLDYNDKEIFVQNNGSRDTKIGFRGINTESEVTLRLSYPDGGKFEGVVTLVKENYSTLASVSLKETETVVYDEFDSAIGWTKLKDYFNFKTIHGLDASITGLNPTITFDKGSSSVAVNVSGNTIQLTGADGDTVKGKLSLKFTEATVSSELKDKTLDFPVTFVKKAAYLDTVTVKDGEEGIVKDAFIGKIGWDKVKDVLVIKDTYGNDMAIASVEKLEFVKNDATGTAFNSATDSVDTTTANQIQLTGAQGQTVTAKVKIEFTTSNSAPKVKADTKKEVVITFKKN